MHHILIHVISAIAQDYISKHVPKLYRKALQPYLKGFEQKLTEYLPHYLKGTREGLRDPNILIFCEGNFVKYDGRVYRIISIEGTVIQAISLDTDKVWEFTNTELAGIQLTKDIIKFYGYQATVKLNSAYIMRVYDNSVLIEAKYVNISIPCQYVHELQNTLHLCINQTLNTYPEK